MGVHGVKLGLHSGFTRGTIGPSRNRTINKKTTIKNIEPSKTPNRSTNNPHPAPWPYALR